MKKDWVINTRVKLNKKEKNAQKMGFKLYLPLCLRVIFSCLLCNFSTAAKKKSVVKLSFSDARHVMESDLISITYSFNHSLIYPLTICQSVSLWPFEGMSKENTQNQHHLLTSPL